MAKRRGKRYSIAEAIDELFQDKSSEDDSSSNSSDVESDTEESGLCLHTFCTYILVFLTFY